MRPDEPPPLSVAIVCKNSERTIERTLRSVRGVAAEIVAVDSGSTDATIEILRRFGAEVIERDWLGYCRTKQLSLEHCRQPWVLCVDSDESLEPTLRDAVVEAVRRDDPRVGGYEVNRKIWWRGKPLNHAWQPERRLRLARRRIARWTGRDPHDRLELTDPAARVERLAGDLRHDSFETIAEYLRKNLAHSEMMAQTLFEEGERGSRRRLLASPIGVWFKQMFVRGAWRDGWRGWAAASATAASAMMKHMILLERSKAEREPTHADDESNTSVSSGGESAPVDALAERSP